MDYHPRAGTENKWSSSMRQPAVLPVFVGMSPSEARDAAGPCSFDVQADSRWSDGTDPILAIDAQYHLPDSSNIFWIF